LFWDFYIYLAPIAIVLQVLFLIQSYRNYRYAIKKTTGKKQGYSCPQTLLTVPCKGIDNNFERNIEAFFKLDHENYTLHLVVQADDDPAHARLRAIIARCGDASNAKTIKILIAGIADGCSQKIHNLLHSCRNAPEGTEIFAFADADAYVTESWLKNLVRPLRHKRYGATTGYRWFIPPTNNLASFALSSLNAKVAQLLGNSHFNQAWGGSMAIRTETFHRIGLDKAWQNAISDDLCLSHMVKKAKMIVAFVPACLVASYESTTWPKLFEFARRQFLITRISTPGTWWFGIFSSAFSLFGSWGALVIAIIAAATAKPELMLYAAVPISFFACQTMRAIIRQRMIVRLLPNDAKNMKPAIVADILGASFWPWLMFIYILSSAIGRKITWRGTTYKLIGPTQTEIIKKGQP
jgi:cellulose synthase/poly-beta-1,6-N-acetylglucosamine synthase-like glycosyltransferase